MSRKHKPPTARLNATVYAMALEEMAAGPTTRRELSEHTGLSGHTVTAILSALHKRRLIFVAAWERDTLGRFTVQAFQLGGKADAAKPAPQTGAELARSHRARKALRETLYAVTASPASEAQVAA